MNKALLGFALYISAFTVNASLIGSSVDIAFDGTTEIADCSGVVVSAAVECSGSDIDDDFISVDIFSSSFIVNFGTIDGFYLFGDTPSEGTFNIILSGLNWFNSPLTKIASIGSSSGGAIGNSLTASLTGDNQVSVFHNDPGANCLDCGFIEVSLTPEENMVPAPATLALIGVGLAGLGWKRRKT